jgi:hypothetical protein
MIKYMDLAVMMVIQHLILLKNPNHIKPNSARKPSICKALPLSFRELVNSLMEQVNKTI